MIMKCQMRRRPLGLPFFWRQVTHGQGIETYMQKRDWILVLNACDIDFRVSSFLGREHIYVPPLLEKRAKKELAAYISENLPKPRESADWPLYPHPWLVSLFLLPLVLIHGLILGWWPAPPFLPPPGQWPALGELNSLKILVYGQWERLATALTLHADLRHLSGNLLFGSIFMAFLARLTGVGRALLLTILGGVLGNLASLLAHDPGYRSLGFSTAIFAALGVLAMLTLWREKDAKKLFMPLAAGLGLLALLGTAGEHADYVAHLSGFGAGCLVGAIEGWRMRRGWPGLSQTIAGALGFAIPLLAWAYAFANY